MRQIKVDVTGALKKRFAEVQQLESQLANDAARVERLNAR
jgi:hypothetical protein